MPTEEDFSVHTFQIHMLLGDPLECCCHVHCSIKIIGGDSCQRKKLSSEPKKHSAEGNPPARNLANLCARKSITSEKANTVPDRPSRRSPSVFHRHAARVLIYRRQRKVESRKKPGAAPPAPMRKVGAATAKLLCVDRDPENGRSSARDAAQRQEKRSPGKRAPQHDTAREPRDRLQPDKLREQKAVEDVP
jgi:hypothetical protein